MSKHVIRITLKDASAIATYRFAAEEERDDDEEEKEDDEEERDDDDERETSNRHCAPSYDGRNIAVTRNLYYRGDAVFAGFDLLAYAAMQGTGSAYEQLLLEALLDIQPERFEAVASGALPVTLKLENEGIATPGETATIIYNAPTTVLDPGDGRLEADGRLIWNFYLPENNSTAFSFWLGLDDEAAAVELETTVSVGLPESLSYHDTLNHIIDVDALPTLLDVDISLDGCGAKTVKNVQKMLDKARTYEAGGNHKKALSYALKAAEFLGRIDSDEAKEARYKLAWVIKALGAKLNP